MNVSTVTSNNSDSRRNSFIQYANSFMSLSKNNTANAVEKAHNANNKADKSMGIETLTIFPKQVIDGKTIITA